MASTGEGLTSIIKTWLKDPADSLGVEFHRASGPEIEKHSRRSHGEWGDLLTEDEYVERENTLRKTEAAQIGHQGWTLVKDGESLSGCETLEHRAFVLRPGKAEVESTLCHNIGTVFTPKEQRKGFGSTMMLHLAKALKDFVKRGGDTVKPDFSYLFSDIGQDFYAKNGWRVMDDRTFIQIRTELDRKNQFSGQCSPPWGAVTNIEVDFNHMASDCVNKTASLKIIENLCAMDRKLLKQSLKDRQAKDGTKTYVAVQPTPEIFTWFWTREQFTTETFKRDGKRDQVKKSPNVARRFALANYQEKPRPTIKGAVVTFSGRQSLGWILWSRMFYAPTTKDPRNPTEKGGPADAKPNFTLFILRIALNKEEIDKAARESEVATAIRAEVGVPGTGSDADKLTFIVSQLLLRKAYDQAHDWKMDQIEIWRPKPLVVEAAKKMFGSLVREGTKEEADIPSLNWHRKETEKARKKVENGPREGQDLKAFGKETKKTFENATKHIEWVDCEKYCWGV